MGSDSKRAADTAAGWSAGPEAAPADPFASLRRLASDLRLKDKALEVVFWLCDAGGRVPVADLALAFDWDVPEDNWNSLRTRLNRKLRGYGRVLTTHNSQAVASQVPPAEGPDPG